MGRPLLRAITTPHGPAGVVHLTAECWSIRPDRGDGEAVSALASHQVVIGTPVIVILPLYPVRAESGAQARAAGPGFAVALVQRIERARLYSSRRSGPKPRIVFIELPAFFDRDGLYGEEGADYEDNALRFAFFCRVALRALPQVAPAAQVVHAHDWQAALAPVYLRTVLAGHRLYRGLTSVLSVRNAAFQDHCPPERLPALGLPWSVYDWRLLSGTAASTCSRGASPSPTRRSPSVPFTAGNSARRQAASGCTTTSPPWASD